MLAPMRSELQRPLTLVLWTPLTPTRVDDRPVCRPGELTAGKRNEYLRNKFRLGEFEFQIEFGSEPHDQGDDMAVVVVVVVVDNIIIGC